MCLESASKMAKNLSFAPRQPASSPVTHAYWGCRSSPRAFVDGPKAVWACVRQPRNGGRLDSGLSTSPLLLVPRRLGGQSLQRDDLDASHPTEVEVFHRFGCGSGYMPLRKANTVPMTALPMVRRTSRRSGFSKTAQPKKSLGIGSSVICASPTYVQMRSPHRS